MSIDDDKLLAAIAAVAPDTDGFATYEDAQLALVLDAARAYTPLMRDVQRFATFMRALGALLQGESAGATGEKAALLHAIRMLLVGLNGTR